MKVISYSTKGQSKSINEDCTFSKKWITDDGEITVIAIADGMGGYECGDIHSSKAISVISKCVSWRSYNLDSISKELDKGFRTIDSAIRDYNSVNYKRGGTTLTCAVVIDNKLLVKNIGDTRCYLIRDGVLKQLSEDHAVFDKEGMKTSKLTRCLGMGFFELPYTLILDVKDDDSVLVCSDGFYNRLEAQEIIKYVNDIYEENNDIESMLQHIYDKGEQDNISLAVMTV